MSKFHVGDYVKMDGYTGEVILIGPLGYKVMFDDPDGPNYDYYPEDELELATLREVKKGMKNESSKRTTD